MSLSPPGGDCPVSEVPKWQGRAKSIYFWQSGFAFLFSLLRPTIALSPPLLACEGQTRAEQTLTAVKLAREKGEGGG